MANNDGLVIKIDGDDSGLEKKLSGIGKTASKALGAVAKGTALIGTAFTGATVAALRFSGELEQNLGGSEAVFKAYAQSIQATANDAFKNMGLSASGFLATANKMGSLFQGAGFSIEESARLTAESMQRAADVASIMGIDVSWAMESIAGAAKGNFTMMDNLGVAMNETTLNAYALEIGLGKTTQQMTNQEKVALALEMFLERTAYAAGNYAKENNTLAGSLTTAKAALSNFISGAGDIDDVAESLSNASQVVLESFGELLPDLVEGIGGIADELIPLIPELLKELIPSVLSVTDELIDTLIDTAPEIIAAIADGIEEALPILSPLTSLICTLAENFDILAASVIAGFAAFKGVAIVNSAVSAYQSAQLVLTQYTMAVNANTAAQATGATTQTLLLSLMKPLEIAIGVLTGKIKLQEAATLALKAAQDLASGGVTLLITAVVAATAAMITYAATNKSTADEIRKAHEEAISAIDETLEESIASAKAEAKIANDLAAELEALEKQIKSGTLSEEEATRARQDFNACAEKLNDIIPGTTGLLYDETGAIDVQSEALKELTAAYYALAVAKAKSAAYEQKITEIQKSIIEVEDELKPYENGEKETTAVGIAGYATGGVDPEYKHLSNIKKEYEKDLADIAESFSTQIKEVSALEAKINKAVGNTTQNIGSSSRQVSADVRSTGSTVKTEASEAAEAVKAEREKALRDLKYARSVEEITERQYYEALAEYRDRYFEEGSEEWQSYTEEIYGYNSELADGIISEYEKLKDKAVSSLEELGRSQESLTDKLMDEGNNTYKRVTVFLDESGTNTRQWGELADVRDDTEKLRRYNAMLDELFSREADLPESVKESLLNMSVDEGLMYVDAMLSASEEEFDNYINGLKAKQEEAEKISKKLHMSQFEEIKEEIADTFGAVPDDFFLIGDESADSFARGFSEKIKNAYAGMQAVINSALSNMSYNTGVIQSANGITSNTTTNNNSISVVLPASNSETTHDSVKSVSDWLTKQEMKGGYR